jgi:hypothetical protein
LPRCRKLPVPVGVLKKHNKRNHKKKKHMAKTALQPHWQSERKGDKIIRPSNHVN